MNDLKIGRSRTRILLNLICKECQNNFLTYEKRRMFCSPSCSTSYHNTHGGGFSGRKHSPETIAKFKDIRKNIIGENNPAKRPEIRNKISLKLKGRNTYWLINKKKPEHSKKMSKFMKEIWAGDSEYKHKLFDKFYKNRKILLNGHSKLHSCIKNWLIKEGFQNFKSEQIISKFIVDEIDYQNRIILEINGDFWHANPKLFKSTDILNFPGRKVIAENIWKKDEKRISLLKEKGYIPIIIWEDDFKHNRLKILEMIKNVYQNN